MPIHDYHCAGCGATFEVLVRTSSNAATPVCRECGGETRRLLSGFSARTPSKHATPAPVSRNRPGRRVELPAEVPRPAVELGPPPPLPTRYVKQLKEHGHC